MVRMRSLGTFALPICMLLLLLQGSCYGGFESEFLVTWSPENIAANDGTNEVSVSLTQIAGSSFATNDQFLYGFFSTQLKLPAGNSAGTVTSIYATSYTSAHDEIDFEFLGNETGQPYLLQTNIFINGVGGREQRMFLWFDPTVEYHTYSIIWNHKQILWLVDNIPVRVHKNQESTNPNTYPYYQKMGIAGSIFDGSQWATRGGAVPIDYSAAPWIAMYKDLTLDGCKVVNDNIDACNQNYESNWWEGEYYQSMSVAMEGQLQWVIQNYRTYDYCSDRDRFPTPNPECAYN